jgi:hypothetical protein
MPYLVWILTAVYVAWMAVGLYRSISRQELPPQGWCNRTDQVCPALLAQSEALDSVASRRPIAFVREPETV